MTARWWRREEAWREGIAKLVREIPPELQPSLRTEWNFEGPSHLDERFERDRRERLEMKARAPKGAIILQTQAWILQAAEHAGHVRGEAAIEAIDIALQPDEPEKPKRKDLRGVQRVGITRHDRDVGRFDAQVKWPKESN